MNSSRRADIHCHLLPQWDDGPRSLQSALNMARRAVENGLSDVLVTPHVGRDLSGIGVGRIPPSRDIPAAVATLQTAIREDGLNLNLWPGAELVIAPDLPARLDAEPSLTTGRTKRYALVELLPGAPWTDGVDDLLFQIALRSITPIVAHPERYADVQRDFDVVTRAANRGILFQLTAASLMSKGTIRDTAYRLLDDGLISFVASDAHHAQDIWPQQVQKILIARLGEEGHRKLQANALALLPDASFAAETETVEPAQPIAAADGEAKGSSGSSNSWWKRWFASRKA